MFCYSAVIPGGLRRASVIRLPVRPHWRGLPTLFLLCDQDPPDRPAPGQLNAFFANVISGWEPATNQNTGSDAAARLKTFKDQDLQTAKINGTSFTMTHKMGLVNINISNTSVDKVRYYINSPTYTKNIGTYEWYSVKQTIYASSTYSSTSPYCLPYIYSTYVHYYITSATGTTQFSTSNTLSSGYDNPNSWTQSVTNSSIANGNLLVLTKTPSTTYLQRTAYTLELGDVFYSDGSISKPGSSNLYSGKTPIGIVVFISANDTEKAWAEPTHNGGRALVMAFKNYGNSNTGYYLDTSTSGSYPVWSGKPSIDSDGTNFSDDKSGYTNCHTYLYQAYNPASYYAMRYTPAAPESSSGWFIPSAGQWMFVLGRLYGSNDATIANWRFRTAYDTSKTAYTKINKYLSDSGVSYLALIDSYLDATGTTGQYWTSTSTTLTGRSAVWYQNFALGGVYITSESDKDGGDQMNLVRPFLAF